VQTARTGLAVAACAVALVATPLGSAAKLPAFSFVGGGDIALVGDGATTSTFAGIQQFLHGNLVMANLEGTLASNGSAKCAPYGSDGCYTFRAAPASARVLRHAGFNVLNVANNHALDYGEAAHLATLAALRGAGIAYDGLPHQIAYVQAGPVKVALIGCAPYRWAQSLLDIPAAQALVRRAKQRADVVIVYMHAGAEGSAADHVTGGPEVFLGEQRGNPLAFAHAMINAGASMVFASGPHTLRGLEWFHGHVVAYSLGNLAGQDTLSTAGPTLSLSALLTLKLDVKGAFLSGRVVPLRLSGEGTPSYDAAHAAIRFLNTLSREDFGSRAVKLGPTGTILPRLP
jgi:poly-gamma-glutamate capsule biosynthesis protein CapA/YwtB (metallophosphatase superfamily)